MLQPAAEPTTRRAARRTFTSGAEATITPARDENRDDSFSGETYRRSKFKYGTERKV